MSRLRSLWRWLIALIAEWSRRMVRKVLIQNTEADPVMSYEDVAVLTGTETVGRQVYVGDDDPAILHAADLIPGDRWTDTTIVTGWPFVEKVRNVANDGWDFAGLVLTVDGKVRAVVRLELGNPDGGRVTLATYDENEIELGSVGVGGDGSVGMNVGTDMSMVNIDASGTILLSRGLATISLNADETITIGPGFGLIIGSDIPTSDPAVAGVLWEEPVTFNIKRSQG